MNAYTKVYPPKTNKRGKPTCWLYTITLPKIYSHGPDIYWSIRLGGELEDIATLIVRDGPGLSMSGTTMNSEDDQEEITSTTGSAVGTVEDLGYWWA